MRKSKIINITLLALFVSFICISHIVDYNEGIKTAKTFYQVLIEMLNILPSAFVLIGLFEVWVKKEKVSKQLGENSGFKAYLWVLILAGFSVGGLYIAFPIAESLRKKGASLKVIFTYLGFVGTFRIPMTIFEISFLGLPFTIIRLMVSIPLFLLVGILLGTVLKKRKYHFISKSTN